MSHALAALVSALLLLTSAACSLAGGQDDRYLGGASFGPYRGRVVDADTGQPLPGAVVVARWLRVVIYPLHSSTIRHAAREAATDKDGAFVIEARKLEEQAPPRTLHPFFVVFLPGYAVHRRGDLSKESTVIGLRRLRSPEDRLENVQFNDPYTITDSPFDEIPQFTKLVNQERVALGLDPLSR